MDSPVDLYPPLPEEPWQAEDSYIVRRVMAWSPAVAGAQVPGPNGAPANYGPSPEFNADHEPNLITSIAPPTDETWAASIASPQWATHAPAIDLDVPCELLPSSQPGHYHLYIHKRIPYDAYKKLLIAMTQAGIVEAGFYGAFTSRGYTSLRPIGQSKIGVPQRWSKVLARNARLLHIGYRNHHAFKKVNAENIALRAVNAELHAELAACQDALAAANQLLVQQGISPEVVTG